MNAPKIFEGAMAATITAVAVLTDMPRIRTWQAIDEGDARWTPANDRVFPIIDIRGRPAGVTDNGMENIVILSLLIGTKADDDPTHSQVALYFAAVQDVVDSLYAQQRAGTAGTERNAWDAYISNNFSDENDLFDDSVSFNIGDGIDPYEDAGINFIGINFNVHYYRTDWR